MEKHIDFFRKLICITLVLFYSCQNDNGVERKEYSNFIVTNAKQGNVRILKSRFIDRDVGLNSLSYNVYQENDTTFSSYFSFNGKDFKPPHYFNNKQNVRYEYSSMPHYIDNNDIVARSFKIDNLYVFLIRGENPFCNGSNCTSYYTHLLVIKDGRYFLNNVYLFDDNDIHFNDLNIKIIEDKLVFSDKSTAIDKIKI